MNWTEAVDAAVAELDAMGTEPGWPDWERIHSKADGVLVSMVPEPVADAYRRLVERAERDGFWATA